MATGDLKNNIAILESELKTIKYNGPFSIAGISKGDPVCFLPLFHYIFLEYSPLLANYFSEQNYDLYGKRDKRFMEAIYSALRDVFNYKPKISRDQFFSKGFAERKCILVTDTIKLAKEKRQEFMRFNREKQRVPLKQINKETPKPITNHQEAIVINPAPHPNEINESVSVDDSLMDIPRENIDDMEFKDSYSYNPLEAKRISPSFNSKSPTQQLFSSDRKTRTISADLSYRSITPIMDVHQNEIVASWTIESRNTPRFDEYESKAVYPEIISHIPRSKSNSPSKSSLKSSPSKRTVLFQDFATRAKTPEPDRVQQLEESLKESNEQQKLLMAELEAVRSKVAELENSFKLLQGILAENTNHSTAEILTPQPASASISVTPKFIPQPAITPESDISVSFRNNPTSTVNKWPQLDHKHTVTNGGSHKSAELVNQYEKRYTPSNDIALRQSVIRKTSTPDLRVN